jgi:hypothetical protein
MRAYKTLIQVFAYRIFDILIILHDDGFQREALNRFQKTGRMTKTDQFQLFLSSQSFNKIVDGDVRRGTAEDFRIAFQRFLQNVFDNRRRFT